MSIFENLNQTQPTVEQLKKNPSSVLQRAGLNVPAGMNDPQQIINYLLQSGQINNPRLQMAQKMMGMIRR